MMREQPFPTREEFRDWLRAKPKDEVIAHNWSCTTCPLAHYLSDRYGGEWYVSPTISDKVGALPAIYRRGGDGPFENSDLFPLPEWANDFAHKIDKRWLPFSRPDDERLPATAGDLLKVLKRVG